MDPNYKDFMAWKKSARGRGFVCNQDEIELEKLRQQSNLKINNILNLDNIEIKSKTSVNIHSQKFNQEVSLENFEEGQENFNVEPYLDSEAQNLLINENNDFQNNNISNNKFSSNFNNPSQNSNSKIPIITDKYINNIQSGKKANPSLTITTATISANFDFKRNRDLHMGLLNNNSNISNSNQIVSKVQGNFQNNLGNMGNNKNNSNRNYNKPSISSNNINNSSNNDSKSYNLSFHKIYNSIKSSNPGVINESKSLNAKSSQSQKKKRNIYFQLVSKEYVAIETDFFLEPALMTIVKEYGGRFDREARLWFAPYRNYIQVFQSLKDCQAIGDTALFPISNLPIEVIANINYTVLKYIDDNEKKREIDYSKDRIHSIFELPSSMLTNLYGFQKTGIEFGIKKKGRMLLADEMGVGKTIQAIGICAVFKENWPVLILCPSSLRYNWRDEITNWLKDIVTEKEVQIIKKSKDELNSKAKFFIVSYDLSIRIADKITEMNFQMAVADEAHYLKSRESKRSKLMVPIMQKCKRVLLLSGTPILAKPVEIYPLLKILRPDLFRSFKPFGSRYCDPKPTPFGIDWNGAINSKELNYILNNLMIRRLKKDVLSELPPKKRQKVEVQTDGKILNQIRVLLNKSAKVDLENENLMSRIINIEEEEKKEDDVLSCFTKAYALTGKAKIVGIVDYVSYLLENNCKFLIFAHHRDVLNAIEEEVIKQKVKYVRIDGDVPTEKRHIHVNTFQNDDTCLVAVLGITACATGLTLTKASTVVFAEMHFTPAVMIQAEDRAHRIGQEHTCVNVHYLYGTDTVDEIIFPKLREKFFVVSSTLDDKRMDMDLQKIKTGCIGEFVTKNKKETLGGDSEDQFNSNNLSNFENKKILSIGNNNKNKSGDKKGLKLTDYFKIKNKSEKKEQTQEFNNKLPLVTDSYIDDEYDQLVEGILQDEEFMKSLTTSEIKNQQPLSPNLYADRESTDVTNINLHQNNFKRDRKMFDPEMNEYSLLEDDEIAMNKSNEGNNILIKRIKKEK